MFRAQDASPEVSAAADFPPAGRDGRSAAASSFNYPRLDGLRGEVAFAALLSHSDLVRGGFLRVNTFFTLS